MKYQAVRLASVREAKAQEKAKTEKIDESFHPPGIMTKPLQGKVFVFKRGRLLGPEVAPAVKPGADAASAAAAGEATGKGARQRRAAPDPAPSTWGRALKGLPGPGRP